MDAEALRALDDGKLPILDALEAVRGPAHPSGYTPHLFTCLDGKGYWVKASAQQGLVAELVAGRLAAQVAAGPLAKVIRVPQEALPEDGSLNRYLGIVVGMIDEPGTINVKELAHFGRPTIAADEIRPDLRARVVVFQSWLGVGDHQVLLNLNNGGIFSIDHGECFSATDAMTDPSLCVCPLPGVPSEHGREYATEALDRVESLSDGDLLQAVAQVPSGPAWRSDKAKRLSIARWLSHRRDRLRAVIGAW